MLVVFPEALGPTSFTLYGIGSSLMLVAKWCAIAPTFALSINFWTFFYSIRGFTVDFNPFFSLIKAVH